MITEIVTIYEGPDRCKRCLGWKRIANDEEGLPWKYWAELPSPENLAVVAGIIVPVECPHCMGSGIEPKEQVDDVREQLAAYAHTAWSGWMEYLFKQGTTNPDGSFTIRPGSVERWARQMRTTYWSLPEEERKSDLAEADQILAIVRKQ